MSLKQIFEGWRNNLIPPSHLQEQIQAAAVKRMEICSTCPFNSKNRPDYHSLRPDEHCTVCGCTLSAKTACLSCECPEKKWGPELTPEEEKQIDEENETHI